MKLYVTDHDGNEHQIEGVDGWQLMEAIRDEGMQIKAECGGACACATCHVYVEEKWFDKLPKKDSAEEDMLDMAFEPNKFSRLGCQLTVTNELDGLVVKMPSKQG